jgi:hypothetical protein
MVGQGNEFAFPGVSVDRGNLSTSVRQGTRGLGEVVSIRLKRW